MLFRPLASLLLLAAAVQATLPFGGVCLSGLELGISTKGAVRGAYKAPDVTQISHFVGLGANLIRIPVAWHYLVGGKIGGELDATYCALVDSYVQAALSASADCEVLLELDTFGGFGGKALGQGFVSIDAYADLWAKLSARYAGQARVSFSLRNSVSGNSRLWASACQAAVAKIRASGCVSNKIALGLGGGGLIQGLLGLWGSAMLSVKDTISLTDGLVFDISSFLDGGALGVSGLCLGSNSLAIGAMHSWLSLHKRRAFLHTGGGSNDNCARFLGSGLATLEAHSSSFLGFTIAGAGAVSGGLSIAPRASGKDCSLVSQVIAPRFPHFGVGVSAGVGAGASASAGAGASLNASVGLPAVSAGVGASLGASAALPAASASVSAGPGAAPSASGAVAAGGSVSADLSTSVRVNLPSLGGVVLSGLEFGIDAKGSLTGGLTGYSAPDVKQIAHFVSLGSNLIRLPLGWKYLVAGGVCGASELEASYLALIDTYVKASLAASADCRILLDLDTFGHFGGVAVGTGDITIDKLASVYGLLAAKYKGEKRVLFGISNSFAGSVDVDLWAKACQAAVVSIRAAGAVSSAITLGFGARAEFAGLLSIWGDALLGVKDSLNAAGGIAFDFSLFLDAKGAGVSSECSLDAKASVSAMHSWLGSHGRQAFISTGAGSNAKCVASLQLGLTEIKKSASILGFSIAGAGSVQSDFGLSIVPKGEADVDIVSQCIKPFLPQHCACEDTKVSKRRLDTEPTARRRQVQPHQERSRSH